MTERWLPVFGYEHHLEVGLLRVRATKAPLGSIGNAPGMSPEVKIAAAMSLNPSFSDPSAGIEDFSIAIDGITPLKLPPGSTLLSVSVTGGSVNWTQDGSTPSAIVGALLADGGDIATFANTAPLQFYPVSGSPVVTASYVLG